MTPEFTQIEHDILTEVATVGAAHAAGSVAQMINHKVDVTVPELALVHIEQVPELMGHAEQTMTVVIVKIEQDADGVILLLLPPDDAARLVADIAPGQAESALEEIANIFAGTSLGALSRFLDLRLRQSIPGSATDMVRAIVNEVMSEMGMQTNSVLLLSTGFTGTELSATAKLYFIFNAASTQKILIAAQQQIEHGHDANN